MAFFQDGPELGNLYGDRAAAAARRLARHGVDRVEDMGAADVADALLLSRAPGAGAAAGAVGAGAPSGAGRPS